MKKEEKTFLEKRIEEKARERVKQDMRDFAEVVYKSPILRGFKIMIDGELVSLMNHSGTIDGVMFNCDRVQKAKGLTNIERIKLTLLEKYKEEETDNLMEKLDNYLFNNKTL